MTQSHKQFHFLNWNGLQALKSSTKKLNLTVHKTKTPQNAHFWFFPFSKTQTLSWFGLLITARHLYICTVTSSHCFQHCKDLRQCCGARIPPDRSWRSLATSVFWENRGKVQSHWVNKGWEGDRRQKHTGTQSYTPVLSPFLQEKDGQ